MFLCFPHDGGARHLENVTGGQCHKSKLAAANVYRTAKRVCAVEHTASQLPTFTFQRQFYFGSWENDRQRRGTTSTSCQLATLLCPLLPFFVCLFVCSETYFAVAKEQT